MRNIKSTTRQCYKWIFLTLLLLQQIAYGQHNELKYQLDYNGILSTGEHAPFWLQTNKFGKIANDPFSTNLGASIYKELTQKDALFDYGFNADIQLRTGNLQKTEVYIQQLYLQSRWWIFDLTIGAKESNHGCISSPISSGNYLFSNNARPMPKITLGIENFITVPYTYDLLEIKGGLSHGWFADGVYAPDIYLHHKYAYGRVGGKWPVRLQVGLDHAAQWGGNLPVDGKQKFSFENYKAIFFGHSGGEGSNRSEQINALGNHLISVHIKLEATIKDIELAAYWQTLSEDGPIRILPWQAMNKKDGLWGISVQNNKLPFINSFVYEFFSTLDQSGPFHDRDGIVYGGNDSYFTNGIYKNDWTHYGRTIGNPLILSPVFNKNGSYRIMYNDLRAHHVGLSGNVKGFSYRLMGTFSNYYFNNKAPAIPNTSWLLEINKTFKKISDTEFSISFAGDSGVTPGKTSGLLFSVRKNGILFQR